MRIKGNSGKSAAQERTAVLFGSIGLNRGDDLMSRVLANACKLQNLKPIIASTTPLETKRLYGDESFHSSIWKLFGWLTHIKNSKLVIIGGGTLIQNDFGRLGISGILRYTAIAILISKLIYRKRVLVLGIGINRVTGINKWISSAYKLADMILVRDDASIRNAKAINIGDARKLNDIGLCFSLYDKFSSISTPGEGTPYICLSLVKETFEDISLDIGTAIIQYAISNELKVKAICMDARDTEEFSLYEALSKRHPNTIEIIRPEEPYELINNLRHAKLCIGMRLHFCVLSLTAGQRPFVLSREEKQEWIPKIFPRAPYLDIMQPNAKNKLSSMLNGIKSKENFLARDEVIAVGAIDHEIAQTLAKCLINAG